MLRPEAVKGFIFTQRETIQQTEVEGEGQANRG